MMKTFLYYFPGRQGFPPDSASRDAILNECGLSYLTDAAPTYCQISNGPGDGRGGVLAAFYRRGATGPRETIPKYCPDSQTWVAMGDSGVWLGWANDAKPTADDLRVGVLTPGCPMILGDGGVWIVPVAREFDGVYGLADDGSPTFRSAQKYSAFWAAAQEFERRGNAGAISTPDSDPMELAQLVASVMNINYAVGPYELLALEAITRRNVQGIACIVEDSDSFREMLGAWAKQEDGDDSGNS